MPKHQPWKVYMHISKIDGKAYCGITSKTLPTRFGQDGSNYDHCTRFYEAIQRDGWDSFEHVLIMPDGTREEAEALERAIIKYCHLAEFERGYNTFDGSENGVPISDTARSQLHMYFGLQRYFSPHGIILYDATGKRVREFCHLVDCAQYLGVKEHVVSEHALHPKTALKNGMFVRNASEYKDVDQLPKEEMIPYRSHVNRRKPVNQYDLNGKYIRTYDSVVIAGRESGVSRDSISQSLNIRTQCRAGNYQWRLYDGSTDDIAPFIKHKARPHASHCSPVCKLDPDDGHVIKEYLSITEAARDNNVSKNAILMALGGKIKVCKGGKWVYANKRKANQSPGEE